MIQRIEAIPSALPHLLEKYGLVVALSIAFLLRAGMALYVGMDAPPDRLDGGADVVEFEHMAWTFSQGRGMRDPSDNPSAFRAPGYPFMLGLLYAAFGHHYYLNRLLLVSLSVGSCALVFPLARALRLSRSVSALATLICAALPLQFYYPSHFLSEPAATFFNTLTVLFLVWGLSPERSVGKCWWWITLAGLFNGASIAVRPISLLLIPALPVLVLVMPRWQWRRAIAVGVCFGVASALVVLPCTIRNYRLYGGISLVSTNGGSTLWGSNNSLVADPYNANWGYWISTNFDMETKRREVLVLDDELARDKAEMALGIRFWFDHPSRVPVLVLGKFVRLLDPFPLSNNSLFVLMVGLAALMLTPFSLLGLCLVSRDRESRQRFVPLLASLLVLLATTAIFYGSERFRSPLEPQQSILAAMGLAWTAQYIFTRRMPAKVGHEVKSPVGVQANLPKHAPRLRQLRVRRLTVNRSTGDR